MIHPRTAAREVCSAYTPALSRVRKRMCALKPLQGTPRGDKPDVHSGMPRILAGVCGFPHLQGAEWGVIEVPTDLVVCVNKVMRLHTSPGRGNGGALDVHFFPDLQSRKSASPVARLRDQIPPHAPLYAICSD